MNFIRVTNKRRELAEQEAEDYSDKYKELSTKLEDVRKKRFDLLAQANMPLKELSIEDSTLTYKGKKWDCMSSTQQLKTAVAITKALDPNCGFVLIDKLEQFDSEQLKSFGDYLISQDLQVIATRVSNGSECSIIIEDGFGGDEEMLEDVKVFKAPEEDDKPKYEMGVF